MSYGLNWPGSWSPNIEGGSIKITLDPKGISGGWNAGWERGQEVGWSGPGKFFGGLILGLEGAIKGQLGQDDIYGWKRNPKPSTSNKSTGDTLLKTQTAGTGSNFGRYGDISQQAPGGWIRLKNKNRDGRSSTLMTRGLSKKQINARHTA